MDDGADIVRLAGITGVTSVADTTIQPIGSGNSLALVIAGAVAIELPMAAADLTTADVLIL